MSPELIWAAIALVALGAVSVVIAPRVRTVEGFFFGRTDAGAAPRLGTLILSQVTTWIFARSLMNAAILGYFYGYPGALAYAAYYLSFLTGAAIIDALRFRRGYDSIQTFLADRFGAAGGWGYTLVVSLRLVSEIFANLLVVGLVFGATGDGAWSAAILIAMLLTLAYAMMGGLRASLKTDVFQCAGVALLIFGLVAYMGLSSGFDMPAILAGGGEFSDPGWVLLAVAALQVISYPLHDPVMMDRGFLADRATTRRSFLHACWISALLILAFGLIGVQAGLVRMEGEAMMETLTRLLGGPAMAVFGVILALSAASTLDSTLSSASKLALVDLRLGKATPRNGRIAMAAFAAAGLAMVFIGSKDLFSAVAVSGTASMFLLPVILFCIWGDARPGVTPYLIAFAAAMGGAVLYFLESSGYVGIVGALTGLEHKYSKLLVISLAIAVIGCTAFAVGAALNPNSSPRPERRILHNGGD